MVDKHLDMEKLKELPANQAMIMALSNRISRLEDLVKKIVGEEE